MNDGAVGVPRQGRESEEDRQRTLAALRVRLHEEAQAVRTPEDWARCLRLAGRLPGESFANILLISAQRPGATLLRGYDAWRAMGRQVSRQEKGMTIFSAARQPRPGHRDPRPRPGTRRAGPELARCRTGGLRVGPFPDQRPCRHRAGGHTVSARTGAAGTIGRPVLDGPA